MYCLTYIKFVFLYVPLCDVHCVRKVGKRANSRSNILKRQSNHNNLDKVNAPWPCSLPVHFNHFIYIHVYNFVNPKDYLVYL